MGHGRRGPSIKTIERNRADGLGPPIRYRVTEMNEVVPIPKPTIRFYRNDSYPVIDDLGLQETMTPLLAFQAHL